MNKFLLVLFFSASKILALDLTFELVYESTDIAVGEDLTGKFYELCYNESVDSASVYLGTSDSVSLGVLAWANGLGQGVIKLDVFNIASPDDNIILELHFDTNQLNLINNENYNPQKFKITKAYPNPFNPNIAIDYNLKEDSKLSLNIYNSTGKHVKSLFDEYQSKGSRSIKWNATNDRNDPVSAGLYIFTMQVGKFRQTKKIVLLK